MSAWTPGRALLLALGFLLAGEAAADPRVQTLPLAVAAIEPDGTVVTSDAGRLRAEVNDGKLELIPAKPRPTVEPVEPEQLPHSRLALGTRGPRGVDVFWLAQPTARYPHGVLGDGLEAAALRSFRNGIGMREVALPEDAVFEDLEPRLADLDGDGRDEVIVVRSTLTRGSALVVYGVLDDALVEKASSPPIGRPNRWLNPVGVADLDGDGQPEVLAVETPHIGGTLRVWRFEPGRLREVAALPGFCNHVIGSTELALHALIDWDLDGRPDVVLPDATRTTLRVISFSAGSLREIDRLPLPGPVTTRIAAAAGGLLLGTKNGFLVRVRRR